MTDPLFCFGLLADVQYADDDSNVALDRQYRASPAKLRAALADFDSADLAFVIHLGDFVDHDLTNATPLLELVSSSTASFYHVLGNHDFASTASPTGRSDLAEVMATYGMDRPYYAIDQPGWRLLVLDTNEVGVIEYPPGSPQAADGEAMLARLRDEGRPNANSWNGTLGAGQREWLAGQLERAAADDLRVAIFAHHPVYPDHQDNLLDDQELRDWLSGFGALKIWISGHQHAGGYGEYHGIHFLTLSAVVQSATNAYATARVYPDRIVITGQGRQPSYELMIN